MTSLITELTRTLWLVYHGCMNEKRRGRPPRQTKLGEPPPESAYGVALNYGLLERITKHSQSSRPSEQPRNTPLGRHTVLQILWALMQGARGYEIRHSLGLTSRFSIINAKVWYYNHPEKIREMQPYWEMRDPDTHKVAYRCMVCGSIKATKLEVEAHCVREVIPEAYLTLHWPFTPEETEILGGM